jgi:hypothetical protein
MSLIKANPDGVIVWDEMSQEKLSVRMDLHPLWIDVKDKLPDQGEKVLWYDAMFDKVHAFALDYPEMHDGDYTHWMLLPIKPESGSRARQ